MNKYASGSPLERPVQELIAHVARGLRPDLALALQRQVDAAVVVRGTATMLDVQVGAQVNALLIPDGPLPVTAVVVDDAGNDAGEILIWIKAGRLIGVEHAWATDAVPTRWPSSSEVRLV